MIAERGKFTLFDTDLFIHCLSSDPPVRYAAKDRLKKYRPSCVCSFSFVELKGNILQDYIFLQKKIFDSSSFEVAASRILKYRNRRMCRMFSMLIKLLGKASFLPRDWPNLQNQMLVALDNQIANTWIVLHNKVDLVVDDILCNRAEEEPTENAGKWKAVIHKCREDNTTCRVVDYLRDNCVLLESLIKYVEEEDVQVTGELNKIKKVASRIVGGEQYEWRGDACRDIGDLLIGLHSVGLRVLVSSNKREHEVLSKGLGYNFEEFPLVAIRS